jgi:CRP-like cAMP-binding protein
VIDYSEVLEQLREERDRLDAAIEALAMLTATNNRDAARMAKAFQAKSGKERTPRPTKAPDSNVAASVAAALKRGAMSPGELEKATGISRFKLNQAIKEMEASGIVRVTGATSQKRIAWSGAA